MYLSFLLNVFYMLCILIFIYIIRYFLSDALWNMYIYAISVERVCVGRVENLCVGHVANLCVTRSETMHLTWTYEMRGSWIIQRILDSLRMTTVACYLVFVLCVFHSWFR
jgi:hypothetical protein